MATRRDVAEAAGVSLRTVSNVVNGYVHVAPETRDRVLKVVRELNYRPSEVARSLKIGRSGLVGLMLPDLDTAYFAELTRAFVEGGVERGLTVVIDQSNGDREQELAFLHRASTGAMFDALVASPLTLQVDDITGFSGGPLVFIGERDYPGFDKVMVDNVQAAYEAVTHLIDSGRRRIAAIGAEATQQGTSSLRLEGYRKALAVAAGSGLPEIVQYVSRFGRSEGAEAMTRLLARPERPDAVFCFSDALALGALRVLHQAGVSVPDEVAVIGWDDIEDGRFASPSLTTICPDKQWIARTALDRIMLRLTDNALPGEVLIGPHRLIVRESSP